MAARKSGNGLSFTKEEYGRLISFEGKLDILGAKMDALSTSMTQTFAALQHRDDAQAEKIDAVAMRVGAVEIKQSNQTGEAQGIARAWSAMSTGINVLIGLAALYFGQKGGR